MGCRTNLLSNNTCLANNNNNVPLSPSCLTCLNLQEQICHCSWQSPIHPVRVGKGQTREPFCSRGRFQCKKPFKGTAGMVSLSPVSPGGLRLTRPLVGACRLQVSSPISMTAGPVNPGHHPVPVHHRSVSGRFPILSGSKVPVTSSKVNKKVRSPTQGPSPGNNKVRG